MDGLLELKSYEKSETLEKLGISINANSIYFFSLSEPLKSEE